ncbi:hypothetical protein ACFUC1_04130 [Pedococcus sp. NPDC057267]|uniref:hypothetical protein n=1 Tax=Pedococcus sp. NPDC057267 TaxID=3346077 RepID=UPI0036291E6D
MTFQHPARAAVGLTAAGAALVLAGCGGTPKSADVTVTVTPTVTATGAPGQAPAPSATSDVKGRAFDYGTVRKVSTIAGTTVIVLDRWTWKGLDDAKLAQQGVPTGPFTGPVPYENQNDKLVYSIPVVAGARILVHHCVAKDQPLQTKSADAAALAALPDRENTVLVKLDDQGRMVAADNIPGCPG